MIKRLSGRKRQQVRTKVFRANPLCVECEKRGIVTLATELDHKVALVNGGTNEESNLAGICKQCHIRKTAKDLGYKEKKQIGLDGWPIDE